MRDQVGSLARHVRSRRQALRLSIRAAASAAGIDRDTWKAAELGTRRTSDATYTGIETALRWQPGSIEKILIGQDPEPADCAGETQPDEEQRIIDRAPVSDVVKERMRVRLAQLREQDRRRRIETLEMLVEVYRTAREPVP